MPIIDFHNHYYPPEYLKRLQNEPSAVRVTIDADGNPCLHYPGDYNVCVPGHRDVAYRAGVLKEHGVDTQVISLTTPGTHVETRETAISLARLVNDAFADAAAKYPGRYVPLATLPLNDPAASLAEFKRTAGDLRFPGATLFSNVNGTPLYDKRFWPIYEAANERGAVFFIHPTHPVGVEAMLDYWLMPLVGFLMDTTLAAAGLVFAGVPKQFPRIKWVLGHLGGAIPYLAERLDRGYEAFPDCRVNINRKPSEYLKEHFYFDTVNFDPHAIKLAISFAGAGHVLAGSDYPHQIGSIPKMLDVLRKLDVSEQDHAAILGGNAARILGL